MGVDNRYTLVFFNNTTVVGNICIFQMPRDTLRKKHIALVWLSKTAFPKTKLEIEWDIDEGDTLKRCTASIREPVSKKPDFWIVFGDYEPGYLLDLTKIPNKAKLSFTNGIHALTAILDHDYKWKIRPSTPSDKEFMAVKKPGKCKITVLERVMWP